MRSLPLRPLVYEGAKLAAILLRSSALLFLLFVLFGLSLLLLGQGDRIGQPLRALPFLLLESLGSLLPLALLLGLQFWERGWRREGEAEAMRSLTLPAPLARLGLLLGLLPFVWIYAWVLMIGTPKARQALWASGPALLRNLQDPRDLSRAAAGSLGLGITAKSLEEGRLDQICAFLPLEGGRGLGLRAESLELEPTSGGFEVRLRKAKLDLVGGHPESQDASSGEGAVEPLAAFAETRLFVDPGLGRGLGPLPPEIVGSPTLAKAIPELVRLAARNFGAPPLEVSRLETRYRTQLLVRRGKLSLLLGTLLLGLLLAHRVQPAPSFLGFLPLCLFLLLTRVPGLPSFLGALDPWPPLALLLAYLFSPGAS